MKNNFQRNPTTKLYNSGFNETDIKRLRKKMYTNIVETLPGNPTTIREVHEALVNRDIKTV